ncbi:MAG: single-stranded DNA-binding protein [Candidatus Cloacimonadota bacterium]|nr:MAG: single-stranded DNA-binding protein [Candidatus Cloacimonadota bacterium]PIE78225.1 MAG: single-stranded DNA-binding protein [Candidatus Delongbacteria bacterium]
MASLNKVILIGNLGKDPEVKYLPSGIKLAKFSIATSERYKKGENWEEKTEWHNIVSFGKIAERAGDILKKGTSVYLEGRISTNAWETETGEKRHRTEIIASNLMALANRKEFQQETSGNEMSQPPMQQTVSEPPVDSVNDIDDDLPF